MTQTQKIIKYFAISLAVFLIVGIFSGILGVISSIFGFTLEKENNEYIIQSVSNNVEKLDIELNYSRLTFKLDDEFKVETNNEYVVVRENEKEIIIKDKRKFFTSNVNNEVIIYLPIYKTFNVVSIDSGSGSIEVEYLNTNHLELDLGAGAIKFDELLVSAEADIDSGAGKMVINSSNFNNLDLDMGIGEVFIEGVLSGKCDIDAGIGELNINLKDSIDNYKLILNKGIGEINVNGEAVKNNYNTLGNNIISIDGGIGSINIKTDN